MEDQPGLAEPEAVTYDLEQMMEALEEWGKIRQREAREVMDRDLRAVAVDRSRSAQERAAARMALRSLAHSAVDPRNWWNAWIGRARLQRQAESHPTRPPVIAARARTAHRAGRSAVHGASRRASARSGDSGDDPDGKNNPEGPPPSSDAGRRFCAWSPCGEDITHMGPKAKFCSDKHKVAHHRNKANPSAAQEADAYLRLPAFERDALVSRVEEGCRCNGHHVLDGENGDCVKCGRPYRDDVAPYYVEVWERRDALRSYIRAVSYDHEHRVAA